MARLRWFGAKVSTKIRRAQIMAVNAIMSDAVIIAKQLAPFQFGVLQRSIGIAIYAEETDRGVSGSWGSQDVEYALYQELGTQFMPANPYLRPAADSAYPQLAATIKRFVR